jgi:hypothetical protein
MSRADRAAQEEGRDYGLHAGANPPTRVKGKPRLYTDLEALSILFSSVKPPPQALAKH